MADALGFHSCPLKSHPPSQPLEQPCKDVIPLVRQWLPITLIIKSKLFSMVHKAPLAVSDLVFRA